MALNILSIGVDEATLNLIQSSFLDARIEKIQDAEVFFEIIESANLKAFGFIVCTALSEIPAIELAQTFKMKAPDLPLIYVSPEGHHESLADLKKNGFDSIFYVPMDRPLLEKFCRQIEKALSGESKTVYKSVPLLDLEKGSKADFDVYIHLPVNDKFIKLVPAGGQIKERQIEKMKTSGINLLFVEEGELDRYCEAAAAKIKEIAQSGDQPQFLRQKKLEVAVRNMFIELLSPGETSFDDGKLKLAATHQIIESFVGPQLKDVKAKIADIFAETGADIYAHSLRVSSIAALFSIGLSKGKPEDLAIAGLFHDIGLVKIPERLWFVEPKDMNDEDRQLFSNHPAMSLTLVTDKKMMLFPEIQDAVLNHHENPGGTGYPKGLKANKVSISAQILNLANRLEELTSIRLGKKAMKPLDALDFIKNEEPSMNEFVLSVRPFFTVE